MKLRHRLAGGLRAFCTGVRHEIVGVMPEGFQFRATQHRPVGSVDYVRTGMGATRQ